MIPVASDGATKHRWAGLRSESGHRGSRHRRPVLAVYLTIAFILDFKTLSFNGDAVARMANGFYVLYSGDPHLAAIGFVWNPLQSILDILPLLFKDLWPSLASHDMAGSIVSVLCMVGAVHQVRAALREWGVLRGPRLLMTLIFAINPMILFYSGNGMSEALYLFTLIATARYLARWLRYDDLRSLIYAAVTLGLCYLARNEAVLPAILAGALVLAASYGREQGPRRERRMRALTDSIIFLLPFLTALIGWSIASDVITGQLFPQFTSQYGNTAQLAASGALSTKVSFGTQIRMVAEALEYIAGARPHPPGGGHHRLEAPRSVDSRSDYRRRWRVGFRPGWLPQ